MVLLNDIDLSGLPEWTPIGAGKATGTPSYNTLVNPFTGVFNGQGFTISGIQWTFDAESEATHLHGLFGALKGATVKNLKLVSVDPEQNLMLIKGAVPGGKNALVQIRMA